MSQAGLVPLIAAWLRDTQGVEPVAPRPNVTGPVPPGPPPRAPFELRAPSMYTQDVPRPAYPGPSAADLVRGSQPTITASQRAALRSEAGAEPELERMAGPVEPLVSGGGKALYHVGKAATQGVGPVLRELAKLGWVREPLLEAGKSRLGLGTKSGKAETEANRAKLAQAEEGAKGPAIILPGKRVAADVRVREALKSGEILPEFAPHMGPWEGQGGRAETLSDLVTLGQEAGGGKWYAGMKDLFPKLYSSTNPRAQAGVMAALSPRREAQALTMSGELHKGSNPEMWRRVMDVYEQYGLKGVESRVGPGKQVGIMGSGKENVLRALRGEKIGAEDALKIRSFQDALVEVEDATALDRWWKRILYPGEHAQGKEGFSVPQYLTGQHVVGDLAKQHNVSMLDAGGAAWVGIKIIDQGKAEAMLGGQPFKDSLRQVWEKHGRDLAPFGPQGQKAAMGLAVASLILQGQMPGAEAEAAPEGALTQKVFGK